MSDERERLTHVYERYRDDDVQKRWATANPGNAAIVAELRDAMAQPIEEQLGTARRPIVLDLGCGSGSITPGLAGLRSRDAVQIGIDILFERLAPPDRARAWSGEDVATHDLLVCGDGTRLPFDDAAFDLAVVSTVFSSILDDTVATGVAVELQRVLCPGGAVLWYDMRRPNPANRHLRPMTAKRVRALFPGWSVDLRPVTLLPPLARRLGTRTPTLYPMLSAVAPLRSHLVGLIRAPTVGPVEPAGQRQVRPVRPT